MATVIEIEHDKVEHLSECAEKVVKYSKKLLQCLEEIGEYSERRGRYGMKYDKYEDKKEDRYEDYPRYR